jgi:hypothetical protein
VAKKQPQQKSEIDILLDKIRKAMAECNAPELEMLEALVSEADGWEMRLEELEEEEDE